MFTLRKEREQEGRKSEKRRQEEKAEWVTFFASGAWPEVKGGQGEAEGGASQHHHRVAPETTATVGRSRGAGPGKPGGSGPLLSSLPPLFR